jgi:hypothetical protein
VILANQVDPIRRLQQRQQRKITLTGSQIKAIDAILVQHGYKKPPEEEPIVIQDLEADPANILGVPSEGD